MTADVVPGHPAPAMVCQECKHPQILPVNVSLKEFKKFITDYEKEHEPCGNDSIFIFPETVDEEE